MKSSHILSGFVVIGLIIALLYVTGNAFYLWWTLWWFDILMHFLGGVWVGFLVWWFFNSLEQKDILENKRNIFSTPLLIFLSVLLIGILWEIFEVFVNFTATTGESLRTDTFVDLVMDMVGGGFIALIAYKNSAKNNEI